MKTLDLHGLNSEDARRRLQMAIMNGMKNPGSSLQIITGRGTGVLFNIIGDELDQYRDDYQIDEYDFLPNQRGYLVYF